MLQMLRRHGSSRRPDARAYAPLRGAQAVDRMRGLMLLFGAHSLHRKKCILRTAVAFFANAGLLAPQVAIDGIALRHFVVAVALGKAHASAVGKLAQQREHLPFNVGGRPLGGIAEINLVLDLQPAQLSLEYV